MPRYTYARGGRRDDLHPLVCRSAWEANWARYLEHLRREGRIVRWEYEPERFMLTARLTYTPDFRVWYPGAASPVYHEVKGRLDPRSLRVLRAMAERYPRVRVVLVDRAQYERVERELGARIPHWEYRR